jgi:hypothetical protein
MSKFNSHAEFQQLKEVIVGQGYPLEYFDFIQDQEVRQNLQKIFGEIEEDFQHLIKTLEDLGVKCYRPGIPTKEEFARNPTMTPPLTPRDRQQVLNSKMVRMNNWNTWERLWKWLKETYPDDIVDEYRGQSIPPIDGANASCIFKMGKDIWFDQSDFLNKTQTQWLKDNILTRPDYRFHDMVTDGHSDCVFTVLKPGVILTSFWDAGVAYKDDFPNWKLHRVENPSLERFNDFRAELHPGFSWWVPGVDNAPKFKEYVDTYLGEWVGEVHESVFDVNCLVVNEENVIFGCYDEAVFKYCEANGINPILCDIRHRFFFDGSVHCCTLDTVREGDCEDYFS